METKIHIEEIRNNREKKIYEKIKEKNNPNLSYQDKRLEVLDEMNSSNFFPDFIFFPNNIIKIIDIEKIRLFKDKQIKEKINNLKDTNLSYEEKHLKILDEENTSVSRNEEIITYVPEIMNNLSINNQSSESKKDNMYDTDSTCDISQYKDNLSSTGINDISELKKDYWIKYSLYDVIVPKLILKNLIICELDKKKNIFCYLYSNKLMTYYFIKNIHFGIDYSINDKIPIDKEYNESCGLFFCGNKIKLENKVIQECLPDKMICVDCMDKNRKRYNLEKTYLININGRVSIEYKGEYHCFGHFLVGNQIENCIQKFSCEACKLLDKYEKYYFPNK